MEYWKDIEEWNIPKYYILFNRTLNYLIILALKL